MPAPTLPALTWNSSVVTPLVAPTGQDILDAIATRVTASTHWQVASSGAGFVEVSPKSVDADVADCRILFSSNNTVGMWYDAVPAGNLVTMGIAPDGGAGVLGSYNSADPYGDGKFSGYSRILPNSIEKLWIIESEEILCICGEDTGTDVGQYGGFAGAWLRAFTTGGAEADGRLWGMAVSGGIVISSTFWTSDSAWMSFSNGANAAHTGVFVPGVGWAPLTRIGKHTVEDTGNGYLTDISGAACSLPFYYRRWASPYNFIGAARQLCVTEDRLSRLELKVGGTVKRVVWGSGRTTTLDALGFFNL